MKTKLLNKMIYRYIIEQSTPRPGDAVGQGRAGLALYVMPGQTRRGQCGRGMGGEGAAAGIGWSTSDKVD